MFESAEIGHRIDRKSYRASVPALRQALLAAQYELLAKAGFPVLILVNGVDGAGKRDTVNLLNQWMDPRHIRTEAFVQARDEHGQRPEMWRFWHALPPRGRIGIFLGSWYTDPILAQVQGLEKRGRFGRRLDAIRHFERMLVAEGVLLVKLWLHLPKKAAVRHYKALDKDPVNAWRLAPQGLERLARYDDFITTCERTLRRTSTGEAPWMVIEGSDPAYRALTAGQYLLDAMRQRLDGCAPQLTAPAPVPPPPLDGRTLLDAFDYARSIDEKRYERKLAALQARLNALTRDARMAPHSLVVVFEGMDAAGKGSTIRRVTQALDASQYRVVPVAAPSDEELAQPYLWRFWRHIPSRGRAVIFDRSWYGRVLVERVEGFCSEADWMRAYDEINAFEDQLTEAGAVVVKFWMAITPDEQLRRFNQRQATPHKNFKITDDDWRNRDKWPQYARAVGDMTDRTSSTIAPWCIVASDDKLFARIEVMTELCERLEAALAAKPSQSSKSAKSAKS